jgi:hypothetical protein
MPDSEKITPFATSAPLKEAGPMPRRFVIACTLVLVMSLLAWAWVVCRLANWAAELRHRLF